MENRFPCAKCGNCCKELGKGNWTGISLFPWETHLFPEDRVNPSLGLGGSPEDDGFRVILYLYDGDGCIHLDDDWCLIHDQRPVICRSYPFRMSVRGKENRFYELAPECSAIQQWPPTASISERFDEMDAAEFIGEHLMKFYSSDEPKWRFREGVWAVIGKG